MSRTLNCWDTDRASFLVNHNFQRVRSCIMYVVFWMRLIVLGFLPAIVTSDESCQDICDNIPACTSKGSFCKVSADGNQVCQGLYYRNVERTITCFADDPTCPGAIPVRCPGSPPIPPSTITCESICAITPACAFSPKHQASYCKLEQETPTCFGLFWRNPPIRTEPCYWPVDSSCPQGDPVKCG